MKQRRWLQTPDRIAWVGLIGLIGLVVIGLVVTNNWPIVLAFAISLVIAVAMLLPLFLVAYILRLVVLALRRYLRD